MIRSESVTEDDVVLNDRSLLKIGRRMNTCRGGYSSVYEGNLDGKSVAVETMQFSLVFDDVTAELPKRQRSNSRFLQRAHLMKQLSHPHIAKILKVYESTERGPIVVMERLHHTLRYHLERNAGKLSRERQLDMCLQIADAVHYLHSQQPPVVYRNLSPTTALFISPDSVLKLCTTVESAVLPSCGYFDKAKPGSFAYMPPEALGDGARYNEKIDIFSFGLLMLEIATQRRPLDARKFFERYGTVPDIEQRTKDNLSLLSEDHPLKPIILQCLRNDPGARPDSGTVFRTLSEGETLVWLLIR